jgi:hypothetical protein
MAAVPTRDGSRDQYRTAGAQAAAKWIGPESLLTSRSEQRAANWSDSIRRNRR